MSRVGPQPFLKIFILLRCCILNWNKVLVDNVERFITVVVFFKYILPWRSTYKQCLKTCQCQLVSTSNTELRSGHWTDTAVCRRGPETEISCHLSQSLEATDLESYVAEPVLVPEADVVPVLVHHPRHLLRLQELVVLGTLSHSLQVKQNHSGVESLEIKWTPHDIAGSLLTWLGPGSPSVDSGCQRLNCSRLRR